MYFPPPNVISLLRSSSSVPKEMTFKNYFSGKNPIQSLTFHHYKNLNVLNPFINLSFFFRKKKIFLMFPLIGFSNDLRYKFNHVEISIHYRIRFSLPFLILKEKGRFFTISDPIHVTLCFVERKHDFKQISYPLSYRCPHRKLTMKDPTWVWEVRASQWRC